MRRKKPSVKQPDVPLHPLVSPQPEVKERPGEFSANMLWLKTNWSNYKDRWVALSNGKLVVSAANREDINSYLVNHPFKKTILCLLVGKDYMGEEDVNRTNIRPNFE